MSAPDSLPTLPESVSDLDKAFPGMCLADAVRAYALATVEAEREAILDLLSDALQSDLEHGVKWLNENAAKEFEEKYPKLFELGLSIRSRTKESTCEP
jgi:hypothetical protein